MAPPLLPLSITLEEHFSAKAYETSGYYSQDPHRKFPEHITSGLRDIHDARIKNMDDNGVAIQIISHAPTVPSSVEVIRQVNDELHAAVNKDPTRFAGFALLPMLDADAAAAELERCVTKLGFVGALVDNHTKGNFYDGPEYNVLWSKAIELDVPIYIHPAWPTDDMNTAFYSGGGLSDKPLSASAIGAFGFGWHASTATTILRLMAAKVFDTHPSLKIIIGHSGELLPFMFDRIDRTSRLFGAEKSFKQVMHENIWITTSGMFDVHSLRCLLGSVPVERVLFSVDYPFSDNQMGREYLEKIQKEGILDDKQLRAFAFGNAVDLLFKGSVDEHVGLKGAVGKSQ